MKALYRYLFKEILLISLSATGVLTFFLVAMNVFKDVFELLLNHDVPLWMIAKMILLLVPFVLTFALPWGLLLAVLLVFGRMSQENELTALKSSGIGIGLIMAPVIWIALIYSGFSFWVNASLGPQCRQMFKEVGYEVIMSNPMAFFASDRMIDQFKGYRIYVGKRDGDILNDIHIWMVDDKLVPVRSLRADRARVKPDLDNQRILLTLYNARQEERNPKDPSDITKIRAGTTAAQLPLEISLGFVFDKFKSKQGVGGLTLAEIRRKIFDPEELLRTANVTPMLTEIQKRLALSISCFTFVLVGIPLAIQTQRRETSIGIGLSLVIVLAYYFVIVLAEGLKKNPHVYPDVIIWLPNLTFQALGFFMLWRVNRQ